jgi:hypothetical protein
MARDRLDDLVLVSRLFDIEEERDPIRIQLDQLVERKQAGQERAELIGFEGFREHLAAIDQHPLVVNEHEIAIQGWTEIDLQAVDTDLQTLLDRFPAVSRKEIAGAAVTDDLDPVHCGFFLPVSRS